MLLHPSVCKKSWSASAVTSLCGCSLHFYSWSSKRDYRCSIFLKVWVHLNKPRLETVSMTRLIAATPLCVIQHVCDIPRWRWPAVASVLLIFPFFLGFSFLSSGGPTEGHPSCQCSGLLSDRPGWSRDSHGPFWPASDLHPHQDHPQGGEEAGGHSRSCGTLKNRVYGGCQGIYNSFSCLIF